MVSSCVMQVSWVGYPLLGGNMDPFGVIWKSFDTTINLADENVLLLYRVFS